MCLSSSPKSEPVTVLLWGHQWWLPGRAEPLDFENLSHAAEILAARLADEPHPVRLRLLYQPETLASVAAACPHGNRATLQNALGFEHPAITDPANAWSHEPILVQASGFGTIVHYEQEPGLFQLIERLAQCGVIVTTAWPMATFLHALPAEWSESGALTVIAVNVDHAIAYHHPAGGSRALHQWHGDTAAAEATGWLQKEVAKYPDDPALMLTASNPVEPIAGVECLPITEALASPVVLPGTHPAQLLPATPFITPQRAVVAASILLLLTAGWTGTTYAREFMTWTEGQQAAMHEKSALRNDIARYRVNAAEIVALRARLAGSGSSPPVGELLDAVCGTLPPQIALDSVRVAQGRFTLSGHVAPGVGSEWDKWRTQIGSQRWTLGPATVPRDTGAFTLNGVFTP